MDRLRHSYNEREVLEFGKPYSLRTKPKHEGDKFPNNSGKHTITVCLSTVHIPATLNLHKYKLKFFNRRHVRNC
jgi:hypothetical protein